MRPRAQGLRSRFAIQRQLGHKNLLMTPHDSLVAWGVFKHGQAIQTGVDSRFPKAHLRHDLHICRAYRLRWISACPHNRVIENESTSRVYM